MNPMNARPALSRRRFLAGAATLTAGATSLVAVGCGSDDDDEDQPGASGSPSSAATSTPEPTKVQPRRGGALRINQTADIVLNAGYPFVVAPQNRLLPWMLSEGLVRYRSSVSEPELVLAERFEYNADRTKLVVGLKPGVTFHNGAPVTPEDVFFGIDFHLNPKQFGVTTAGVTSALAKAITDRKKLDERTMEFTFDRTRYDMTGFFVGLNITQASSFPQLLTGESVQGTGPYMFKKWTPGVGFTMVRNPNWHLTEKEGGPYLDEIQVKSFADEAAAANAFEAGDLEIAFRLPGASAKRFRDAIRTAPRIGGLILAMVVKNPTLADKRVRQALFLAVDKQRIADEIGEGFYGATSQLWPEYSPAYDKSLDVPSYDPERAKALLKEAAFNQSEPITIEYSQRSTASVTVAQKDFEAIGVKVNLVPVDAAALVARIRNRQIEGIVASGTNFGDPIPASALLGNTNIAIPNVSQQDSAELADILKKLPALDPLSEEAKALYGRFNRHWLDDPWIIPLEPSGALDAVSEKVEGFDEYFIQPLQAPNFGRIWLKA